MDFFDFKQYEHVKVDPDGRKVLSVNVNPEKACIFNCRICNVGRTKYQGEWHDFGDLNDSLKDLEERMESEKPDVVEVAGGKGDALTNPILQGILDCAHSHGAKARLITNCYLLGIDGHMELALQFDEVVAGFCFTDEETFNEIHRPVPELHFSAAKQTESIVRFSRRYTGKFTLRVLLVKGYNDSDEQVADLKKVVDQVNYTNLWVGTWPKFQVSDERVSQISEILHA